jgi:hypothetical protein
MRKSILKKVTVAVLSAAMLVTSVLPGTTLAKEQSEEGDAIASQNRAALNLSVAGFKGGNIEKDITFDLNRKGVAGTHEVTDENKDRLLYGTNKDKEYASASPVISPCSERKSILTIPSSAISRVVPQQNSLQY